MKTIAIALAVLLSIVGTAFAEEPSAEPDEAWTEDPRRAEPEAWAPPPAELWVDLSGSIGLDEDGTRAAGMIVLGGKFDVFTKTAETRRASNANAKAQRDDAEEEEAAPTAEAPAIVRSADRSIGRGALVRGAVKAALAAAGSGSVAERLSDVATRARASGLVPELRVRVAHVVDEDQSLAPTEYDPERITASGGTSLWLEGRATFRLDRLVFADDEIAVERLRADRAKLERAIVDEVLDSFERWQRADAKLANPLTEPLERDRAEIDLAVEEARLDALTDGWFSTSGLRRSATTAASDEVVGETNGAGR